MISERVRRICIALTIIAIALCFISCGGSEVSPLVGTYTGILHWDRDGVPFWDQQATLGITQEEALLSARGNVRYKLDPAPLLVLSCRRNGSACSAAAPVQDEFCGVHELVRARLSLHGNTLTYEATTSSRCGTWHFVGALQK